jgi:hypothetical protein
LVGWLSGIRAQTGFVARATNVRRLGDIVERGRPQMIIWCMRIACWVPKATNTRTGSEILIAFSLQQWLHGRAPVFSLFI